MLISSLRPDLILSGLNKIPFRFKVLNYNWIIFMDFDVDQVIELSDTSTAECGFGSVTGQHLSAD